MIENIPLPTDNLYKAAFFFGLILLVSSSVPFYRMYQVEVEKERLMGEIENLDNRRAWLKEDGEVYKEGVERLRAEKQGRWEEMPRIDPNSQEYAGFLEATGRRNETTSSQRSQVFSIDIQKIKSAIEEKHRLIAETQKKLDAAEKELVHVARDLAIAEMQVKAKSCENGEAKKFIQSQMNLAIVMAAVGLLSSGFGAYNWRTKTQRYQDAIKKIEAETKSGGVGQGGTHASE